MADLEKNGQITEVLWFDAVKYAGSSEENKSLRPTPMRTRGVLIEENADGVIIKNPYSVYRKSGDRSKKEIEKEPTFLFIPRGMIEKIEKGQ